MRRRITFIHGADEPFDPSQLTVQHDTLNVKSLKGGREDQIILGSQQLPQEVGLPMALQASGLLLIYVS